MSATFTDRQIQGRFTGKDNKQSLDIYKLLYNYDCNLPCVEIILLHKAVNSLQIQQQLSAFLCRHTANIQ